MLIPGGSNKRFSDVSDGLSGIPVIAGKTVFSGKGSFRGTQRR